MHSSKQARDSRGFTLIEILVVVAIIALLISVLLPSLAAARLQAKTAACMSGLRQLNMANNYYSIDNHGLLPHYDQWLWAQNPKKPEVPESGTLFGLRGASQDPSKRRRNYAINREIYKCPADRGERRKILGVSNPILPPTFSYSRNFYLLKLLGDLGRLSGPADLLAGVEKIYQFMPIDKPPQPARAVLLLEEYELSPMNDGFSRNSTTDFLTGRHNGRTMLAYHDLHVASEFSKLYNDAYPFSDYRHYFLAAGLPKP